LVVGVCVNENDYFITIFFDDRVLGHISRISGRRGP
jgi:hypothetical protein